MVSAIPDRWIDYKPIGKEIEGTRFIAFKVPLREQISKQVDRKVRLNGRILLKEVPNLGLIIDLTNTKRFYDPKIFEDQGVEYKKLMIPGHETPRIDLTDKFIMIVKEFIENNKDNGKLIGVHCTHGVNRTGYMICKYMISQMAIDPNDAMDEFAKARGYKIERKNYIDDLWNLQETNRQNLSAKQKVEPENCRKRKANNDQAENWRQQKQNNSQNTNYYKDNSYRRQISKERYERKYNPYGRNSSSRSNPSNYSRSGSAFSYSHSNSLSYARPFNHIDERPHYTMQPTFPSEEKLRIPYRVPYQPPRLRYDYYKNSPLADSQYNSHQLNTFTRQVQDS